MIEFNLFDYSIIFTYLFFLQILIKLRLYYADLYLVNY